jgi:hypothetical protein
MQSRWAEPTSARSNPSPRLCGFNINCDGTRLLNFCRVGSLSNPARPNPIDHAKHRALVVIRWHVLLPGIICSEPRFILVSRK